MTDERGFEAAAERGAVDRGDDRLGRGFDHVEHGVEIGTARRLAEFADVGAGDEGCAIAAQHDRLDAVIGERGFEIILQPLPDVPRQGVDRGVVDDDDGDLAILLHRDGNGGFIGHGKAPLNLKSVRKALCPREGGGPSPDGTIWHRQEMGPRLRGDTAFFIRTYTSFQSSIAAWTRVLTSRRTG